MRLYFAMTYECSFDILPFRLLGFLQNLQNFVDVVFIDFILWIRLLLKFHKVDHAWNIHRKIFIMDTRLSEIICGPLYF